ncbi:hypothetical protein N9O24_00775 [bacterium]|nr:hypothetical protein [bacterium]
MPHKQHDLHGFSRKNDNNTIEGKIRAIRGGANKITKYGIVVGSSEAPPATTIFTNLPTWQNKAGTTAYDEDG